MDWSELASYVAAYMGVFAGGFVAGVGHAWVRRILSAV